jgi:hypothetical protein
MRENPDVYIVGYLQAKDFWDTLLLIGQELPDAPPEPARASLSDTFRRSSGSNDISARSNRTSDTEPVEPE